MDPSQMGKSLKKKPPRKRKPAEPGSIMIAKVRDGTGNESPTDGQQVVLHYTTRTPEGQILESSRVEYGGTGVPVKLILGKSKMLAAWEESLLTMHRNEISMLKVKPEQHYGEPNCPVKPPHGTPTDRELFFEIELLDFANVKAATKDLGVVRKTLKEGLGWENPREPYELKLRLEASLPGEPPFFTATAEHPLDVLLGTTEIPEGLKLGLQGMVREETALITCTKKYLTPGSLLNIPEGAEEVEFEVELLKMIQVRDVLGDGGVLKRRVKDGIGEFPVNCPLEDSLVRLHCTGTLPGGKVFWDTITAEDGQPLEVSTGEGMLPEGLEACLRLMLPQEVAIVTAEAKYAYDGFPRPKGVPAGATVQWEVTLVDFEKPKDWSELTFREAMDAAAVIKDKGNALFKQGKLHLAKVKYEKLLRQLNNLYPETDDEGKEHSTLKLAIHLNIAATYQKMEEFTHAIEECNKVLTDKPGHVKALFRRGMAYMSRGDFDEARNDFNLMLKIDPSSEADAEGALAKLKRKEQESEAKARRQYKGLFDKKPGELSTVTESRNVMEARGPPVKVTSNVEEEEEPLVTMKAGLLARAVDVGMKFIRSWTPSRCTIL